MTDSSEANAANAALVALVTGVDKKMDLQAAAQAEHRREIREELAGIRADAVLRTEYEQRMQGHDREIGDIKRRLEKERYDREAAVQRIEDDAAQVARSRPGWTQVVPAICVIITATIAILAFALR